MDKKSTVNDLYQAAVISVFAVGYSMLGIKNGSEHSEIRSGRHGETGCYYHCIRDDERVSS